MLEKHWEAEHKDKLEEIDRMIKKGEEMRRQEDKESGRPRIKLEEPELKIRRRSSKIEDRKRSQIVDKVGVEEEDEEGKENNEEWKER